MARFRIHYTLEEAETLLPWVRSVFARIHGMLLEAAEGPARKDELALRAHVNGGRNGGRQHVTAVDPEHSVHRQQQLEMAGELVRALKDKGIVVRDLERGLVDFPAWRGDDEVLLCYELRDGERIGWWHGLEDGYAGRRPITEF